jgi:site-specific recombinase XerD
MFELAKKYLSQVKAEKSINTLRGYSNAMERFFDALEITDPAQISALTSSRVQDYLFSLKESGLSAASVNSHGRNILTFFRWANENGCPNELKVKRFKESKKIKAVFTSEEVHNMLSKTARKEKLMILMLAFTGLRRDEIANVKVSDIRNCTLLVQEGKGDKQRIIPLHEDVCNLINDYLKERKCGDFEYLFYSRKSFTREGTPHKLTGEAVRYIVKNAMAKAGIAPERINQLSAHSLRRFFATYMLKNNASLSKIQLTLGHASPMTTLLYLRSAGAEIAKEEIEGLPSLM